MINKLVRNSAVSRQGFWTSEGHHELVKEGNLTDWTLIHIEGSVFWGTTICRIPCQTYWVFKLHRCRLRRYIHNDPRFPWYATRPMACKGGVISWSTKSSPLRVITMDPGCISYLSVGSTSWFVTFTTKDTNTSSFEVGTFSLGHPQKNIKNCLNFSHPGWRQRERRGALGSSSRHFILADLRQRGS